MFRFENLSNEYISCLKSIDDYRMLEKFSVGQPKYPILYVKVSGSKKEWIEI